MLRDSKRFAPIVIAALLMAGPATGAGVDFENIAPDLENLRVVFNNDAGKVRLILLVAPT